MKNIIVGMVFLFLLFPFIAIAQNSSNNCPPGQQAFSIGEASGCETTTNLQTSGVNQLNNVSVLPATQANLNSSSPNGTTAGYNLGYTPLEPIVGVTVDMNGNTLTLPALLQGLFTVLITIGALTAVLMLTIGGVEYMIAESVGRKAQSLKRAQNALWGILLVAGSWLILHTINPNLLNINFVTPCSYTNCTVSSTPTPTPIAQTIQASASQQTQNELQNGNVLCVNGGVVQASQQVSSYQQQSCSGGLATQNIPSTQVGCASNQTAIACVQPGSMNAIITSMGTYPMQ